MLGLITAGSVLGTLIGCAMALSHCQSRAKKHQAFLSEKETGS